MSRPSARRFTLPAVVATSRPRVLITARSAAAAGCVLAALLPALTPAPAQAAPATASAVTGRPPLPVAYVANALSGTISRIRLAAGRAERPVRLGKRSGRVAWSVRTTSAPAAMGLTPDGRRLYVLVDAPGRARGYLIQFNAATGAASGGSPSAATRSRSRSGRAAGPLTCCARPPG